MPFYILLTPNPVVEDSKDSCVDESVIACWAFLCLNDKELMNIISLGYPNLLWDWSVLLFNQICLPFCKHLPWPLIFMCAHMLFLFSIICFLNLYVICAVVFIFFTLCLSCLSYFRALYVYIVFICFFNMVEISRWSFQALTSNDISN